MHTHRNATEATHAALAGGISMAVLVVGLGGLALGIPWAWVAFPVGYGGVLPLALGLAKRRETEREAAAERRTERTDDGPLATLRDRYARGEIDEREFETRVEGLLETEG
ncbi:SHOCT domain-containing protein [Haloarcula marina]|uniref:SHOCT domain-containing protein n=1 Tax=Haloarcula marina TaxID=2961574 RepID=UPI0020B77F54|nr:SHOCT domain-containing protein [Halomicroarcula marina]